MSGGASACVCSCLCVSEDYWHEAQTLPDILTFYASSRTIGAWATDGKKQRQKINLTAFTPFFMWHLIYFTNTFFCVKGTIELTWGLDAGWRRDAGLWTVWFGCCGRQSKPFRWRCSVSPIQEVKDPVPHSSHYSDLWHVTDMQTTGSTALLQRKNKGNVGWDEGKETQSTHNKLEV